MLTPLHASRLRSARWLSFPAAPPQPSGMPQLDISTFTPQLVWLAIWFVVLYLLMAKLALPRVAAAMEARRQRREGDLARATQLRADAEAASAAYQKALAEARAQAQSTIKETSDRLAADAAERQRALAATLAGQIAEAERRIAGHKGAGACRGARHRGRCRPQRRREADRRRARSCEAGRGGREHPVGAGPVMHLFADPEFWVLLAVAGVRRHCLEAGAPLCRRHARPARDAHPGRA